MRPAKTHNFIIADLSLLIFSCTIVFSTLLHSESVNAAKSDPDEITLSIEEQCPNFTRVDELSTRPQLLRRLQASMIVPSTCKYSWIQKKHALTSKLYLDERTGAIYTIDTIDREEYLACNSVSFCCNPATVICAISVSVGVQCANSPMIFINVKFEITDKNDHVPRFPTENFTIEIPESADVGTKFYFPAAVDPDSNPYSLDTYELVAKGGSSAARTAARDLFEIRPAASNRVQLSLRRRLDREVHDRYEFEVRAIDRQLKIGTMNLTVLVTDVNDHSPVFTAPSKLYNVSVPEDTRIGATIVQVHAVDSDVGENAAVTYEFHETASQYVREKFALDEDTGSITLRSDLDFETMSRIEFFVVAKNRATNPVRSDEASVSISVTNVNDESPVIEVEYRNELVDDRTSGETLENLHNTFVAFIFVSDRDAFGGVNCTLSNDRFRLESFVRQPSSTDFRLNATRPFDRESNPLESVIITCTDRGLPPRSSSQLIRIHVKDANDQQPTFLESPIRCTIAENNHVGTPICQISNFVRDLDEGENSLIKYTLEQSASPFFRIEEFSGQLSAVQSFDRENRSTYQFQVYATDQGKPPLSATGTIIVTIIDVNDNAPRFSFSSPSFGSLQNSHYQEQNTYFSVREQRPHNEYVGTVRALDPDADLNGRVVYSLDSVRNYPFRITESGEIFTTRELDREAQDRYQMMVVATDLGSPIQSASAFVTIGVLDVNDCPPNITFPAAGNNTVRISYMEPPGREVALINAFDRDIDGKLSYSIVAGNNRGLFSIDSSEGSLHVAKSLVEAMGEHSLLIRVDDNGSPNLQVEAQLRVIIDNSEPTYDYQSVQKSTSSQDNSDISLGLMHVLIIAALACAIVLVVLIATAVIIRRRLMLYRSVFSTSRKRDNGKTRGQQRKLTVYVERFLPSSRRDSAPKKASAGQQNRAPSTHSDKGSSKSRDCKGGSLQKTHRQALRDVTNQEDLEVQAAFSAQMPEESQDYQLNIDDGVVYAALDTLNGNYDEQTCVEVEENLSNSDNLCPHGRPGVLVPCAIDMRSPSSNALMHAGEKFQSGGPSGTVTPCSELKYFRTDVHQKNVTNTFSHDNDSRSRSHFSTVSFNTPNTIPSNIPMRQMLQDQSGQFCGMYPSRPHTAMHAMQSESFNAVAMSIASPDSSLHCNPQACWMPNCATPKAGYFQYDECNNVAPLPLTAVHEHDTAHHGHAIAGKRDRKDKYFTVDRAVKPPTESSNHARVYGVVKGSFV